MIFAFPERSEGRTYIWAEPIYTTSLRFVSALSEGQGAALASRRRALPSALPAHPSFERREPFNRGLASFKAGLGALPLHPTRS